VGLSRRSLQATLLSLAPVIWDCQGLRLSWSSESFDEWFLAFAYSPDGLTLVRRVSRRFGLGPAIVDDLRQEWVLAVRKTLANPTGGPRLRVTFVDADSAASYVTAALRNKAIDLLRKDRRTPEPVNADLLAAPSRSSSASPAELRSVSPSAEALAMDRAWCELARREITSDLYANRLRCPGCPPLRVAQIALYALNVWCDCPAHESLPAWAAEIEGGTRELDQLVYHALIQIFPEHVGRNDDGRLAANTRKMKQRCGDCVRDLLGEIAIRCHTLTSADAVSDVDGRDHG
jgi:hypothetical protein